MKIISWNINGIRAVYQKGLMDFLKKQKADLICFQEIKAHKEQFPAEILKKYPYHAIASAEKKGYSGVAMLFKKPPLKICNRLAIPKFDLEGRTLIADFDNFYLLNCYFPNGQRDHNRVPYKMQYCDAILKKAKQLQKKSGKEILICGDFNTAHQEIDLANPKTNQKTTGFLPIERQWITRIINSGYVDCFRHFYPEKEGCYTWWTYRNQCRERNIGWRIDYFFASQGLIANVKSCQHLDQQQGSDHCPVSLKLTKIG